LTRIYTRTGDDGSTYCYFLGSRVPKDHPIIEFIGTLDEANSHIGLARAFIKGEKELEELDNLLESLQRLLFNVGFSPSSPDKITETHLRSIEQLIDKYSSSIKLDSFILPSGSTVSAQLHVARTVVRRAERRLVKLVEQGLYPRLSLMILNRISDLLFVLALEANRLLGVSETTL